MTQPVEATTLSRLRVVLGLSDAEAKAVLTIGSRGIGSRDLAERSQLDPARIRDILAEPELVSAVRIDPNQATIQQMSGIPGIRAHLLDAVLSQRPFFSLEELAVATGSSVNFLESVFHVPPFRQFDKASGRSEEYRAVPFVYTVPAGAEFEDVRALSAEAIHEPRQSGLRLVRVIEPTSFESVHPGLLKSAYAGEVVPVVLDSSGNRRYFMPGKFELWCVPGTSRTRVAEILGEVGVEIQLADVASGYFQCGLIGSDDQADVLRATLGAIATLSSLGNVLFGEPIETDPGGLEQEYLVEVGEFEDAPGNRGWNHDVIQLHAAHQLSTGSPDVVVSVIDSGIRLDHPDLRNALHPDWEVRDLDFTSDVPESVTSPAETGIPHGTSVSGVVAGRASSVDSGARGVAPKAWIMPLKISGTPFGSSYGLRALAIRKAVDYLPSGSRGVINLSWSTSGEHIGVREALFYATERNVAVVASAGNYGIHDTQRADEPHFPSGHAAVPGTTAEDLADRRRINGVCSVAATNVSGRKATYSYYGKATVSFAAPGGEPGAAGTAIFVAHSPGNYAYGAGTSYASPHVAGLIALLFTISPALSPQEAIDVIALTCNPVAGTIDGQSGQLGAGLINAQAAIERASGSAVSGEETPGTGTNQPDEGSGDVDHSGRPDDTMLVNINTASADTLASLPSLGSWTAHRIITSRDLEGPFGAPEDLMRRGLLDTWTFAQIRTRITTEPITPAPVILPTREPDAFPSTPTGHGGDQGLISLNTAPVGNIASLPLLGLWSATRIVAHREQSGPYQVEDDLVRLMLLDRWTLDQIRHLITV